METTSNSAFVQIISTNV